MRSRLAALSLIAATAFSQRVITTVAGTRFVFPTGPVQATSAPTGALNAVAVDTAGIMYLFDPENCMVMKVDTSGSLTVVAGTGVCVYSGDGGPATSAGIEDSIFAQPGGVAVDRQGNFYFVDFTRVRKVTPAGVISTVAGNQIFGYSGDGGPATNASLEPEGIALDSAGNLYIADWGNHRIRKVTPGGIITTVAGNGNKGFSGDQGMAVNASLYFPSTVAVDGVGNLFIADSVNNRVRRVTAGGIISTYAGGGTQAPSDGSLATSVSLYDPEAVAVDAQGNLYIACASDNLVYKVSPAGVITLVAGTSIAGTRKKGFSGDGGIATRAMLSFPNGVAVDPAGNLLVADTDNRRLRRVTPAGIITTVVGNGRFRFGGDGGAATTANLSSPTGAAVDQAGNLYIVDKENNRIRKVTPSGAISTVAGNGTWGLSGDGGLAVSASIAIGLTLEGPYGFPSGIVVDPAGNLFIADTDNGRIRRVSTAGIITTYAGGGAYGTPGDGGPATGAYLDLPSGVALDAAGNLYISEYSNRVRRVTPGGIITTVAGTGVGGFSGDNGLATATTLRDPEGLAVDGSGNLYIADVGNSRVRKVSGGIITTVVGNGTVGSAGDGGLATNASSDPIAVAVGATGELYVAEFSGNRVRVVNSAGIIGAVAGSGKQGFTGDGGAATAALMNLPNGLTVDPAGGVFIVDTGNNRVRKVLAPTSTPTTSVTPASLTFSEVSGGAAPAAQTVKVLSSLAGLSFTAQSSASWLAVTPPSGSLPVDLHVSVNPAQPAGTLNGTVTISTPGANPPSQTIAVRFTVAPAPTTGKLGLSGQTLSLALAQGSSSTRAPLNVLNLGGGSIAFTAAASTSGGGAWLQVSPASGTATPAAPAMLTVTANPGTLAAATYSGGIVVNSSTTGERITVPVTMALSGVRQKILLSHAGLTFTAVAQGGAPLPQGLGILNVGAGSMNWTAQASVLSGTGWLSISQNAGAVNRPFLDVSFIDVMVNAQSLAPGDYFGRIQVIAPGAANSPHTVQVVLNVLPAGSNPGPEVRPTGLVYIGSEGAGSPGAQKVMVSNTTAAPVSFGSNVAYLAAGNWLSYLPTNATLTTAAPGQIIVQPNFTGLTPDIRRGALTLVFSDGSIRTVGVLSVVAPAGTIGSSKDGERFAGACMPRQLQIQLTSSAQAFTAILNQPNSIEVLVVDDCGSPVTGGGNSGGVNVAFSNGDPNINLVHTANGRWSGAWQPRGAASGGVRVNIAAAQVLSTGTLIVGQASLTATLSTRASVPLMSPSPVANAASFSSQTPVAPGTLISIFGSGLADGQAQSGTPLPTTLAGAQVTLGGQPLPLLFASDRQVNAQVPYGLSENTSLQLMVQRGSTLSFPEPLTVAAAQPAIFTRNQSGSGQGAIVNLSNAIVDAAAPARAGDTLVIYCTGLGAVNPPVAAGAATPLSPLSRTVNPVTVTIGGVPAPNVGFAGLTPTYAGLYQVNVVVPPGVPAGDQVAVVISVAGQSSPAVTIAVR